MSLALLLLAVAPLRALPAPVVDQPHRLSATLEIATDDGTQPAAQMARAWWSKLTLREECVDAEGRRTCATKDGHRRQSGSMTNAQRMMSDAPAAIRRPPDRLSEDNVTWTLSDPAPFGDAQVPRTITIHEDGKVTGVVHVTKLEPAGDVLPNLLDGMPADAQEVHACEHLQPAKLLRREEPAHPRDHMIAHHQGTFIAECLVDETGHVTLHRILQGTGWPKLDLAAREALRQWLPVTEPC